MRVVGTAGHIDHGKSTLVHRLTGIDPDRLEEEKRRGMTIDLGFAWLTLPSGIDVSIVDVPGHERFIKNMLAGAAGVDVALLVVAADEGVMPQTREHLDILDLLEVRQGVVALTKSDLVDDEWQLLVEEDVRHVLSTTPLHDAPVVAVSALTGEGLDDLLGALDRAVASATPRLETGVPYLPIDRVFTSRGFGTVVTGTLHAGSVSQGEEMELLPGGRRVKIRNLQTHGQQREEAEAGARVAVNVSGISREDVKRGDVLARPGTVRSVTRLDALVRVLPDATMPLAHATHVTAHLGAAERSATVSILSGTALAPDATGWIRLRFEEPVAAVRGQHVILRMPAPARTIAGGSVADIAPRQRRADSGGMARLCALLSDNLTDAVLAAVAGRKPRKIGEIALILGVSPPRIRPVLDELQESKQVRKLSDAYLVASAWQDLKDRVAKTLDLYHREQPLRRGMAKEELGHKVGWSGSLWSSAVEVLAREGVLLMKASLIALPTHQGGASNRREEADRVVQILRRESFSPPSEAELCVRAGTDRSLLTALVEEGEIVRLEEGLYVARESYDDMCRRVVDAVCADGQVTVASVRDVLGTSRKYALALLDHMDSEHLTQRRGDVRVLGSKAPACV